MRQPKTIRLLQRSNDITLAPWNRQCAPPDDSQPIKKEFDMNAIAPILNSLCEFTTLTATRLSRFEAMQPMTNHGGNLDLDRFLTYPAA